MAIKIDNVQSCMSAIINFGAKKALLDRRLREGDDLKAVMNNTVNLSEALNELAHECELSELPETRDLESSIQELEFGDALHASMAVGLRVLEALTKKGLK